MFNVVFYVNLSYFAASLERSLGLERSQISNDILFVWLSTTWTCTLNDLCFLPKMVRTFKFIDEHKKRCSYSAMATSTHSSHSCTFKHVMTNTSLDSPLIKTDDSLAQDVQRESVNGHLLAPEDGLGNKSTGLSRAHSFRPVDKGYAWIILIGE